uniref:Immunoglobulin V-set domain-containing protein n=1 Tax=Terrapene triunguis TaxID=2587831 RepID=A0A674JPQ1_9SAUR
KVSEKGAAELPFAGVSLLLPGLTGPEAVSGLWGRSVSVPCQYHEGYQETPKYWCSGIIWQSFVMTGSEAIVKHDRVSIKDIHTFCTFIVTMKNLTEKDSGTYWCGIDKLGLDLMGGQKQPAEREPSNKTECLSYTSGIFLLKVKLSLQVNWSFACVVVRPLILYL